MGAGVIFRVSAVALSTGEAVVRILMPLSDLKSGMGRLLVT